MLCQDCQTTLDMHGHGNSPGTTLAQVEIECEDCHGTADEVGWAFMRWVHQDYAARTRMPAADALLETLKSAFGCG